MYRLLRCAIVVAMFASDASSQSLTFVRDDVASFAGGRAVTTADFNRDGWPDVAHANTGRNTVTVLLNRQGAGLDRVETCRWAPDPSPS